MQPRYSKIKDFSLQIPHQVSVRPTFFSYTTELLDGSYNHWVMLSIFINTNNIVIYSFWQFIFFSETKISLFHSNSASLPGGNPSHKLCCVYVLCFRCFFSSMNFFPCHYQFSSYFKILCRILKYNLWTFIFMALQL